VISDRPTRDRSTKGVHSQNLFRHMTLLRLSVSSTSITSIPTPFNRSYQLSPNSDIMASTLARSTRRFPVNRITSSATRRFASTEPEGITFSSKATKPASKYEAPEVGREYMAKGSVPVNPAARPVRLNAKGEESFAGPSRPRMIYDRPKEARQLPALKVSLGGNWEVEVSTLTSERMLATLSSRIG